MDGLALPVLGTDGALVLSYLFAVFGDLALLFIFSLLLEHVGSRAGPTEAGSSAHSICTEFAGLVEVFETQTLFPGKAGDKIAKTLSTGLLFFFFSDGGSIRQNTGDSSRGAAGWARYICASIVEDTENERIVQVDCVGCRVGERKRSNSVRKRS